MALHHNVLSAKRQRKGAKRAARRSAVLTYKRQMGALARTNPEAFIKSRTDSPRKLRCISLTTGKRIVA